MSTHKIGVKYGISAGNVRARLAVLYGDEYRKIARRNYEHLVGGRDHNQSREVSWAAVWRDFKANMSIRTLGTKYGLPAPTIRSQLETRYGDEYRRIAARHRRLSGRPSSNKVDWKAAWEAMLAHEFLARIARRYNSGKSRIAEGLRKRHGSQYLTLAKQNHSMLSPRRKPKPPAPRGTPLGRLYERMTYAELGKTLGYAGRVPWRVLHRLPEYQDRQTARRERRALVVELHEEGFSPTEIGAIIGSSGTVIYNWLTKNGYVPNQRARPVRFA